MTRSQRNTIRRLQRSGELIHTVSADAAEWLIAGGYARWASVQPKPITGVAINLTGRGRSV